MKNSKYIGKMVMFLMFLSAFPLFADFNWIMGIYGIPDRNFLNPLEYMDVSTENAEAFMIKIQSNADCYCYIIGKDTSQNVSVIFEGPVSADEEINRIVELKPPDGFEDCVVIMSEKKEKNLEKKIAALKKAPSDTTRGTALWREATEVHTEINGKGKPAPRLVPWGGAVVLRGAAEAGGVEYSDKDRYATKFAIKH